MKRIILGIFLLGVITNIGSLNTFLILRRARMGNNNQIQFSFPGISLQDTPVSLDSINAQISKFIEEHKLGFKLLPYQSTDTITSIGTEKVSLKELARRAKEMGIKTLVWCGIGGQGNGNKAVHYTFSDTDIEVIVVDNMEGWILKNLLSRLDPQTTMIGVSSKSFTTTETMGNAATLIEWLKSNLGEKSLDRIIFNTDNIDRVKKVCQEYFGEDPKYLFRISVEKDGVIHDIGGRYSVLIAGVISGAIAGLDVDAMLKGAREAEEEVGSLDDNLAAKLALYTAAAFQNGKDILVIVPTSDRLRALAEWINQHNGESGGKEGRGQYPLVTVVSSNEELKSLYASADDKMFLFLHDEQNGFTPSVPDGVAYVQYSFPVVSEENVGMFFQFFNEWAVRFPLALGINPIIQPWVDAAKKGFFKLGEGSPFDGISRDKISVDFSKSGLTDKELELNSLNPLDGIIEYGLGGEPFEYLAKGKIQPSSYQEIAAQFQGKLPHSADFMRGLEEGYKSSNLKNIAAQIARAVYLLGKNNGCKIFDSLFYTLGLKDFGDWVDSVARKRNLPIYGLQSSKLVASLNQHDLLQWMGDGPPIAFVMGVVPLRKKVEMSVPDTPFSKASERGRNMGEIYDWMWESISSALKASGRPTATLFVPRLNDYYYGQLFALYDMVFQIYKTSQILRTDEAATESLLRKDGQGLKNLFVVKEGSANQLTVNFKYGYEQMYDDTWGRYDRMFYHFAASGALTVFRSSGKWDDQDPDMGGMYGIYPVKEVVLPGNHVKGYNYNKDNDIFEVYVTPEFYQQIITVFGKDFFEAGIRYGDNKDATIIHKFVFRESL